MTIIVGQKHSYCSRVEPIFELGAMDNGKTVELLKLQGSSKRVLLKICMYSDF